MEKHLPDSTKTLYYSCYYDDLYGSKDDVLQHMMTKHTKCNCNACKNHCLQVCNKYGIKRKCKQLCNTECNTRPQCKICRYGNINIEHMEKHYKELIIYNAVQGNKLLSSKQQQYIECAKTLNIIDDFLTCTVYPKELELQVLELNAVPDICDKIPVEIWDMILNYINIHDLISLRSTSTRFKDIVDFHEPAFKKTDYDLLLFAIKNSKRVHEIIDNFYFSFQVDGESPSEYELDKVCDIFEIGLFRDNLCEIIFDKYISRYDDEIVFHLLIRLIKSENYIDIPYDWLIEHNIIEEPYWLRYYDNYIPEPYEHKIHKSIEFVNDYILNTYNIDIKNDQNIIELLKDSIYLEDFDNTNCELCN